MANLLVEAEQGIKLKAEDVLKLFSAKPSSARATPAVKAGLAVILEAVRVAVEASLAAAHDPTKIVVDLEAIGDIAVVWAEIVAYAAELGIQLGP